MIFLKKYGFTIIKWIVFALSLAYLLYKIIYQQDFNTIFAEFKTNSIEKWALLITTILLLFANWGIEAIKWKYSVRNFSVISFKHALWSVFAGTSVSLFMPNRTGEFVGKIFVLPSEKRIHGVFASFVTGLSQFNITLFIGTLALSFLYYLYPENIFTQHGIKHWILFPAWITTFICLLLNFHIKLFSKLLLKFRFLEKHTEKIKILETYPFSELFILTLLSLIRYAVFLFQFYLLVSFFDIDISFRNALIAAALTFYIATLIPTFSLAEIGVRGTVAVFVFGYFSPDSVEIISATTLLWLINVGTPAFIGYLVIAKFKS